MESWSVATVSRSESTARSRSFGGARIGHRPAAPTPYPCRTGRELSKMRPELRQTRAELPRPSPDLRRTRCVPTHSGARPELALMADQLAQIRQPVLLILGARDAFGGPSVGEEAARTIPHAALHIVGTDEGSTTHNARLR